MSKDSAGSHKLFVTLGASNHGAFERENDDYYATDPRALEMLLELETFSENIWEPACGGGHLSRVLEKHGYNVRSTDLVDRGFGESGIDFLKTETVFDGDIITNIWSPNHWPETQGIILSLSSQIVGSDTSVKAA